MKVVELPLNQLREANWNPNVVSSTLLTKLRESLIRFGTVQNLVARPRDGGYEVLSGNQRLKVYRELGLVTAPCVVVDLDDARPRP